METNSISSLRAVDVSTILDNTTIYVKGYFKPGDGGGGAFIYISLGTEVDNGGISINPSVGSGVWRRVYDGSINIKWFGAMGNELNPEHIYINNAINYVYTTFGYGEVIFPAAWYKLGDITTYSSVTLKGVGNPYIFRKGTFISESYFITINECSNPANWVHSKIAIEGIIDYNVIHIADVQSKNGGVIVLPTFIDNCHIESLSSTLNMNYRINVSSNGVLFIKHCFFSDDSNRLFNIAGQLVLTDNSFLPGDGKYLVNGTGIAIELNNLPPAYDQIARINTVNSGIRNGSFEHDLMEGWEFSAGSNALTSSSNTYDSSKALKIYPTDIYTGTHLISDFISIPTNRPAYILSAYVTNSNHAGAIHVRYYDRYQTFLSEVVQATGFTSIPARIKFQYFFS